MSLAYFEWSAHPDTDLDDPQARAQGLAQANPALGTRITHEACESEYETLKSHPEVYGRERCGIVEDPTATGTFPRGLWEELKDETSEIVGGVAWAVDVTPDRSRAVITATGWSQKTVPTDPPDRDYAGLQRVHHEVVDEALGTSWVIDRMLAMQGRLRDADDEAQFCWVIAPNSPAGSLIKDAEDAGLEIQKPTQAEYAQACGLVYDEITGRRAVHLGTTDLAAAVAGAKKRPRQEGDFTWDRRHPGANISPLCGATYGRWGLLNLPEPEGTPEFFSWDDLEGLASDDRSSEVDDGAEDGADPDDAG
jgi:hypothetical protein